MASLRPAPVMLLTPLLGEAATTSWPPWHRNVDGLRADQAGAADNDDLHGLRSLVDSSELQPWRPWIPAGM
jgi:hypothetical protein